MPPGNIERIWQAKQQSLVDMHESPRQCVRHKSPGVLVKHRATISRLLLFSFQTPIKDLKMFPHAPQKTGSVSRPWVARSGFDSISSARRNSLSSSQGLTCRCPSQACPSRLRGRAPRTGWGTAGAALWAHSRSSGPGRPRCAHR